MATGKSFQQVWRQMDGERRRQAAQTLCGADDYATEQRLAVSVIATRLHMRPQKAAKLPPEKMAGYLLSIGSIDEALAGALVRAYLFTHHQPMLSMFLDDLRIPHSKGVIAANTAVHPDAAELRATADRIRAQFDSADVELYLAALLASDAETWKGLAELTPATGAPAEKQGES